MEKSNKTQERKWSEWFEIPASDFERAISFYENVFKTSIHINDFGSFKMGIFPHKQVGGAICYGEHYQPGTSGPLVYLNANPDLQIIQDRIEGAGGKILVPKKPISPEHGFMALFLDSEGNRLALHSMV